MSDLLYIPIEVFWVRDRQAHGHHFWWDIFELMTDSHTFITPSGVSLSWWQTPYLFRSRSFLSWWQTHILSSPPMKHLGCWQILSLVTLVDHCWVTRANPYAYAFWVVNSFTFQYRGHRLKPFGYLYGGMHRLLYWNIFSFFFFLCRWLISHLAFTIFFIWLSDIYSHGALLSQWQIGSHTLILNEIV